MDFSYWWSFIRKGLWSTGLPWLINNNRVLHIPICTIQKCCIISSDRNSIYKTKPDFLCLSVFLSANPDWRSLKTHLICELTRGLSEFGTNYLNYEKSFTIRFKQFSNCYSNLSGTPTKFRLNKLYIKWKPSFVVFVSIMASVFLEYLIGP